MTTMVSQTALDALAEAESALAAALELLEACDAGAMPALVETAQRVANRCDAVSVEAAGRAEAKQAAKADGHRSAGPWLAHRAHVSTHLGHQRVRVAELLGKMPLLKAAFQAGLVGWEQLRVLERHLNWRNRDAIIALDAEPTEDAVQRDHREWRQLVQALCDLADPDGVERAEQDAINARRFNTPAGLDGTVYLDGVFDAARGAVFRRLFTPFVDAEFKRDWEHAKEAHGKNPPLSALPRTAEQRRADALLAMARSAAHATGQTSDTVCANIVIDHDTYERELRRLTGETVEDDDPARYRDYRCDIDGLRLSPKRAVELSLAGQIRRVVMTAPAVIAELGHRARLMHRQVAVALKAIVQRCQWPGCDRWARTSQADHLEPHSDGGTSDPHNCGIHCGHHNNIKNDGYTTDRQPNGDITYYQPDGTPIT